MWRKTTPKGLKMKKFTEGPDGTLIRDTSYVGENAWDDEDIETPQDNGNAISNQDERMNTEESKPPQESGILG